MDLRSTLNLPDPDFTIPMKADLPNLELKLQKIWDEQKIYHRLQEARAGAPTFVFHDGPPYTNGPIHLGHSLNKSLKDFVIKSRTMMGFKVPYVPGYDNHGLPIEQAVMKKFNEQKIKPTTIELRKACRAHAAEYLEIQTGQFKRLGMFGLWEKPYATMDYRFEAEIVRTFGRMVDRGFVYKGLRPTLWSPTSRTALADTEIVYAEHTSTAIYVAFPLKSDPDGIMQGLNDVSTVIWTTTPWTIPANLAVAFHPKAQYSVVKVGDKNYLLATDLLPKVSEQLGWTNTRVLLEAEGSLFQNAIFKHPVFDRDSIAVMADYVTMEDGTGVVHTAPGHGRDDFYTGLKYNLPILTPVDERGMLTEEAGEFAGISYKDGEKIVDRLREEGALLDSRPYVHSYPHAERDNQPVIFRATEQWFVGIDHDGLRQTMLRELEKVEWFPQSGHNRLAAMVKNRPDWCISRQRPWGVGIPVFYGAKSREPVLDVVAIEAVAMLIEQEGSDAWFEKDAGEILPEGYVHPITGETEFTKETDVLDVWFDSGSTNLAVLEGRVYDEWPEGWPADVYLEGSDQHRGWFNSSLVIGTAVRDQAPYKQLITHGFVTDEKGIKQSKRLGNVVDPMVVCEKYGADVLRYWVAMVDWENDVPCSDNLLKAFGEHYRRVRNTLRFLLGNLEGFDPMHSAPILEVDAWVMEQVDLLVRDCVDAYTRYDFGAVINGVHNFCKNELSSFYLDAIKDRMYCDGKDWETRRSGQIACHYVLVRLTKLLAPILPHTAEEVWQRILALMPPEAGITTVHAQIFDNPTDERLEAVEGSELQVRFASLLQVREGVFAAFEAWKGDAGIKDSQDVIATITEEGTVLEELRTFSIPDLAILFKMSWIELKEGTSGVSFKQSTFLKCERSRLRRPDVEEVDGTPLTARDRKVLGL